jgi:hypothetical protein
LAQKGKGEKRKSSPSSYPHELRLIRRWNWIFPHYSSPEWIELEPPPEIIQKLSKHDKVCVYENEIFRRSNGFLIDSTRWFGELAPAWCINHSVRRDDRIRPREPSLVCLALSRRASFVNNFANQIKKLLREWKLNLCKFVDVYEKMSREGPGKVVRWAVTWRWGVKSGIKVCSRLEPNLLVA